MDKNKDDKSDLPQYSAKVTYEHWRPAQAGDGTAYRYFIGRSKWKPNSRGGFTTCRIEVSFDNREYIVVGRADCSKKDAFCYRIGRAISYGRALKSLIRIMNNDGYLDKLPDAMFGDKKPKSAENVVNIHVTSEVNTGTFIGASFGRIG